VKIIIHRGTKEIGGSCIEIKRNKRRIVLDLGMPLIKPGGKEGELFDFKEYSKYSGKKLMDQGVLPNISGFYKWDKKEINVNALFISHAHQDHFGFAQYVKDKIPIFCSKGTAALLKVSGIFLPNVKKVPNTEIMEMWRVLKVGGFKVTPYLVDHSAPDAVSLLIESEGKKVFYSGDFRAHGRKSILFENILKRPPKGIDVLLLEGTMMSRPGEQEFKNENAVEEYLVRSFKAQENLSFVFCSSQNIDRICSIYRAILKSKKTLVIDLYTAYVLSQLKSISTRLPQFDSDNIKVKYWKAHADRLGNSNDQGFLYKAHVSKIKLDEIVDNPQSYIVLAKQNSLLPLTLSHLENKEKINFIWSMWPGYLTGHDVVSRSSKKHNIKMLTVHTSGHATVEDLRKFANALNPKHLIPIHTFFPEKFGELFDNVILAEDEKAIEI
jgi:ribonuclease J